MGEGGITIYQFLDIIPLLFELQPFFGPKLDFLGEKITHKNLATKMK